MQPTRVTRLRQRIGPRARAGLVIALVTALAVLRPWAREGDDTAWRLEKVDGAGSQSVAPEAGHGIRVDEPDPVGERCEREMAPGRYTGDVTFDGEERRFRLTIPPTTGPLQALVINLHGEGRSATDQDAYSGLDVLSEREGFILLTPDGSGSPPGWTIPGVYREGIADDTGFLLHLLDLTAHQMCVDPARVYATGLSNGAEMAAQLACSAPDRIAAVAAVAGLVFPGCAGGSVAVLGIHGTDDDNVPYGLSLEAAEQWAVHHGCESSWSDVVADHVSRQAFAGCRGGDVVFVTVSGGGHTWPGASSEGGAGPPNSEISASELIWTFFLEHPRNQSQ